MTPLSKTYNPQDNETQWYPFWEAHHLFEPTPSGEPFVIVIPPPNVTGSLHMGHALNNCLQDVLIRFHRMRGCAALWVPGTDHGGIATQNVVEKLLKREGKTRHDLGREKFLERMWQWRKETGDTILLQLKRLGCSCDWNRNRFTMDETCSKAALSAFIKLYQKGLIYRGKRIVNWCPRCQTALADIEVEHEERAGKLWYIRYPLTLPSLPMGEGKGEGKHIVVATTRPETMLGDTAVAVHPQDARYLPHIGKNVKLPLTPFEIPVIADETVDPSFGTGAVKVTPAHDANDFEMGERHRLPHRVVIDFKGRMTKEAGTRYAGQDRAQARSEVLKDLEAQGLLEKTEEYPLAVATCYRCFTVIEPLVSEQWFLNVKEMATQAIQATREKRVTITPESWERPYLLWLENIRDWCISRQIWWGHRIPVYYCPGGVRGCAPIASVEKPEKCPACGSTDMAQDEDVLDTWFSSALWPFSVFGWPEETNGLKRFYPTSVLVTGHEILYLWVARMVMLGLELTGQIPFTHVFIHGIVRDKQGKKMSKSLGNVIDPLTIMDKFGTDALRFALASASVPGRDLQLSDENFLAARNFANKLWNATRFVLMNLEDYRPIPSPPPAETVFERWIWSEFNRTLEDVTRALEGYNLAEAARQIHAFTWSKFCDWYLELAKPALTGADTRARTRSQQLLAHILEGLLKLLHPIMPYETETLYEALKPHLAHASEYLMTASWPAATGRFDPSATECMEELMELVTAIRTLRNEMRVPLTQKVRCLIKTENRALEELLPPLLPHIQFLARVESVDFGPQVTRPPGSAVGVLKGGAVYLPLSDLIDLEKERSRLTKELTTVLNEVTQHQKKLANESFVSKAAPQEVDRTRKWLEEAQDKATRLRQNLEAINS